MNRIELHKFFIKRIELLQTKQEELAADSRVYSFVRAVLFILFLVLIVAFANARIGMGIALTVPSFVFLFSLLVKKHNGVKFELKKTQNLIIVNQEEISRLEGKLHDLPSGSKFQNDHHEYIPDLDVFGYNSMFQLLSRSRMEGTAALMADWLTNHAPHEKILERQAAVRELTEMTEWRQDLTALGFHDSERNKEKNYLKTTLSWMSLSLKNFDTPIWNLLTWLLPAFGLGMIIWINIADAPYFWYFLPLLVNGLAMSKVFSPLHEITKELEGASKYLLRYEHIIHKIQHSKFQSSRLAMLSEKLGHEHHSAYDAIKSLNQVLYFFENRANMVYGIIDAYFLTDLLIIRAAIKWNKRYADHIEQWLDVIHEIEVLSDMASYAFVSPGFCFPKLLNDKTGIASKKMGHPLIPADQRIYNDFTLQDQGSLGLITGSNMSGKSTFLRTVGVNLVLAQMGAPVCADEFHYSDLLVYTSMRTQDNLEESVSSFYAELKRIKGLLDRLDKNGTVFYLLDEILKGTNSEDRHKGAMALIDQLTKKKCIGLISTHDIQLSSLSGENHKIENYSFNSQIDGDEIYFDYLLTSGPCKSFNASKLMEKMGIIR